MSTTLPKYFIFVFASLLLLPLLFTLSSTFVRSANGNVVISEIKVASTTENGGANNEFVELFNPSDSPVDLTDWQLRRKTSTGTSTTLIATLSGEIAPHSYMLIANSDYQGVVVPDATYLESSSRNITANNTIYLRDSEDVVVDKVGMGEADDFEEAATVSPNADNSVARVDVFVDTDNNLNDFEVLEVSDPQNSSVTETPSPTATATATPTDSPTPTPTPSPTPTATPSPSPTLEPTASPTLTPTPTATPSPSPTLTPTSSPTSTPVSNNIATFFFPRTTCRMQIHYVSFGFWKVPFARLVCERVQ